MAVCALTHLAAFGDIAFYLVCVFAFTDVSGKEKKHHVYKQGMAGEISGNQL